MNISRTHRLSSIGRRSSFALPFVSLAIAAAFLAGCSSDKDESIAVADVWARSSPMMNGAGAMYATISNPGEEADQLVSVSVPADIAAKVELHETVAVESAAEETAAASSDAAMTGEGDAMMTMRQVTSIDIPANGEAVLAPGGLHIMLLEMPESLAAGSTFEATLKFHDGDEQKVKVEVRDQ